MAKEGGLRKNGQKMPRHIFHYMLVALSMSACSSGTSSGGSTDQPPATSSNTVSYQNYNDIGRALAQQLLTSEPTTVSELQSTGTVNYAGIASFSFPSDAAQTDQSNSIYGSLELRMDFGDSILSGQVQSFRTADNSSIDGMIVFSDLVLNPEANPASEFSFYGEANGDLSLDQSWSVGIEAVFAGDFYSESTGIAGIIQGEACSETTCSELSEGIFIAAQKENN